MKLIRRKRNIFQDEYFYKGEISHIFNTLFNTILRAKQTKEQLWDNQKILGTFRLSRVWSDAPWYP